MLNRSIKLTSEEYEKVIEVASAIEKETGSRPSFSQVIGMTINNYKAPKGGYQDDKQQRREQ